jgi:hypothetical protein
MIHAMRTIRKSIIPPENETSSITVELGSPFDISITFNNQTPAAIRNVSITPSLPDDWKYEMNPKKVDRIESQSIGKLLISIIPPTTVNAGEYSIRLESECDDSELRSYFSEAFFSKKYQDELLQLTESNSILQKYAYFKDEIDRTLKKIESYKSLGTKIYNVRLVTLNEVTNISNGKLCGITNCIGKPVWLCPVCNLYFCVKHIAHDHE